jgi:putative toxin-antitoxin system antitoxin component (TIGR02293 family)
MADTGAIVDVLGGLKALRRRVARQEELRERVRAGLPYAALAAVVARIRMDQEEITGVLHLTPRTLARRKAQGSLDPDESDRLVRFARVVAHATEVLGTLEKAALWLRRDNRGLGGNSPIEMLDTEIGSRAVEGVLLRLEHGVIS